MLCCSLEYEKLKSWVIGKSINLVELTGANRQRMPVRYETNTLFQEFFLWFDAEMAKKQNIKDSCRKTLVFLASTWT